MNMSILSIDYYRDCSTASVLVSINNSPEVVEYLIHGHNFGNGRFDVTRDGWDAQNYPSQVELKELGLALEDFKHSENYNGWQKTEEEIKRLETNAHQLSGMVDVFRYWLNSQENPPIKAIVPPRENVKESTINKLVKQLADEINADILLKISSYEIRDGKFIFAPCPEGGFLNLRKDENEAE